MKKVTIYILLTSSLFLLNGCFEESEFEFPLEYSWIAFPQAEIVVDEAIGTGVSSEIILSGAPFATDQTINYTVEYPSEGGAKEGVDFNLPANSGSIVLPAGANSIEVNLIESIINNDIPVGRRSVIFTLQPVAGLNLGQLGNEQTQSITISISEDDLSTFGYTSFEEPAAGDVNNYSAPAGTDLPNNPGENSVDHVYNGGEIGFNTSYVPGQEGGADSGLFFGVTNITNEPDEYDVGAFPDGSQGYMTSDADGLAEIVFDELDIPEATSLLQIKMSLWFIDDDTWEDDDEFDVFWRTEDGDELILSLRANSDNLMTDSADGDGAVITGDWNVFIAQVTNIKSGSLVIQIGTDSGAEFNFIDNIIIEGI